MIFLKNITLNLSNKLIFNNISLNINQEQKIGLTGRNGAGKSTLLKLIGESLELDSGSLEIQKNKKIAYMPQEILFFSKKNILDEAFSVFDYYINLFKRKEDLEVIFNSGNNNIEDLLKEYTNIIEELESFDINLALKKSKDILINLGFKEEDFKKPVSGLSSGYKMRLLLAKLLLQEADFYLFDEPTNHLDLHTKTWFENFLKESKFGFLLVTHDRHFLDTSCDYILDLDRGQTKLFKGNFTEYLNFREKEKEIIENSYKRQQKEIQKKEELIEKFRYKATKAKMVQSTIKKLEKIDLIEPDFKLKNINLKFKDIEKPGKIVLKFTNLKKEFNNKIIFSNITQEIERDDKVAIVAPNGSGKTTLINIITDKYKSDSKNSSIEFGYNVKYSLFEQDQLKALNPNNSIIQEVEQFCGLNITEKEIRATLGSFLFTKDDIDKKISVLSGGEKNRVALVKVLLSKSNFLILDEPTNHLDLYSKEILLKALKDYNGTILLVCHDQDFLDKLVNKIFILNENEIYTFHGNYKEYLEFNKNNFKNKDVLISKTKNKTNNKELNKIEHNIMKLEKDIENINNNFFNYEYNSKEYNSNLKLLKDKKEELNKYNILWEEVYKNS